MTRWDWYVHGLWILGSLFLILGAVLAGNLTWIEGTNSVAFGLAVIVAFLLILIAGLMWISAAANITQHETFASERQYGVQKYAEEFAGQSQRYNDSRRAHRKF